jgi:hypothetical protein
MIPGPKRSTMLVDLDVAAAHLRCLQFVPSVPPSKSQDVLNVEARPAPTGDALTAFDVRIQGVRTKLQTMTGGADTSPSLALVVDDLSLVLGVGKSMGRRRELSYIYTTVFDASLGGFAVAFAANNLHIIWDTLSVALEHSACSRFLDAASPYVEPSIAAAKSIFKLRKAKECATKRQILYILKWSSEHTVVDPLSTIQPSYLIQSGRPHELRISLLSKLIVSLRNCLREMPVTDLQAMDTLAADDTPVLQNEVLALLDSQLAAMNTDADESDLSAADWLGSVFPSWKTAKPSQANGAGMAAVESFVFAYRKNRLTVADPAGGSPCHLSSAGLSTTVLFKRMELQPVKGDRSKSVGYRHAVVSTAVEGVDVLVLPHLLYLIQRVLSLRPRIQEIRSSIPPAPSSLSKPAAPTTSLWPMTESIYGDFNFSLGKMRFQIAEEKLVVVYTLSRFVFITTALQRRSQSPPSRSDISVNSSLMFDTVSLAAHSVKTRGIVRPRDALAELVIRKSASNLVVRHETAQNLNVRGTANLGSSRLSVPRSAIRLIKFMEAWREDYLPPFGQTVQTIIAEFKSNAKSTSGGALSPPTPRMGTPHIHIQVAAPEMGISLHVMPGTWLSWEAFDILSFVQFRPAATRKQSRAFGLRVNSQRISVLSTDGQKAKSPTAQKLKLDLPSITISGYYEDPGIVLLTSVGLFQTTVKPTHWDTLLAVQQKFGQDFDDLVHVLADARRKRQPSAPAQAESSTSRFRRIRIQGASLKLRGFRIGLEGRSSTMLFECQDINGGLTEDGKQQWNLTVLGLGLSLAPRTSRKSQPSSRNHRSAFLIIDFNAKMGQKKSGEKRIQFLVERVHGVLQPSSIGELGDFIDHIQVRSFLPTCLQSFFIISTGGGSRPTGGARSRAFRVQGKDEGGHALV